MQLFRMTLKQKHCIVQMFPLFPCIPIMAATMTPITINSTPPVTLSTTHITNISYRQEEITNNTECI